MKINICSGYPLESPKGNSVTAKRLQSILREAGYNATAMHTDTPPEADAILSLHALKTSAATLHFSQNNPNAQIHILLTGTDINGGFEQRPHLTQQILSLADSLVVAQPACIPDIPEKWQSKVVTIFPSLELPEKSPFQTRNNPFFSNIGHLRQVKNPHLLFDALTLLKTANFEAFSIGTALDKTDGQQALINMSKNPRYHWIDGCDRAEALSWIENSLATVNTSYSEGGANTIIEAIHLDTPILASDIAGNRGFLGEDYLGYFPADNAPALAKLMLRCLNETEFIESLRNQLSKRKPHFTRQTEMKSWIRLLEAQQTPQ